jgi:hypothetical protein
MFIELLDGLRERWLYFAGFRLALFTEAVRKQDSVKHTMPDNYSLTIR